MEQIFITYIAEKKKEKGSYLFANFSKVSVNVRNKKIFKHDYFPGFVLCMKNE